jgi:hypothetical protein
MNDNVALLPCAFCKSVSIDIFRNSNDSSKDICRCRSCKAQAPLSSWQNRFSSYEPQGPAAFKTAQKFNMVRSEHPRSYVCGYILHDPTDQSLIVIDRSMLRHFSNSQFFQFMHK